METHYLHNFQDLHSFLLFARKFRSLTQKQVADELGVHQTCISDWEKGKKKMPTKWLAKISHLYQLSRREKQTLKSLVK